MKILVGTHLSSAPAHSLCLPGRFLPHFFSSPDHHLLHCRAEPKLAALPPQSISARAAAAGATLEALEAPSAASFRNRFVFLPASFAVPSTCAQPSSPTASSLMS
ncbi:hypothetical protein EJB05_49524, partial [Eragrostis curvula]